MILSDFRTQISAQQSFTDRIHITQSFAGGGLGLTAENTEIEKKKLKT
jgi:hypothetical protein